MLYIELQFIWSFDIQYQKVCRAPANGASPNGSLGSLFAWGDRQHGLLYLLPVLEL